MVAIKKTYSVYLDELTHTRVSNAVERALSKRGKLGDFIDYIEESGYRAFREVNAEDFSREPELRGWNDNLPDEHSEAFKRLQKLPAGKLIEPLDDYRDLWETATRGMPWHKENPAASHVLALYELLDRPIVWSVRAEKRPRFGMYDNSIYDVAIKLNWRGLNKPIGAKRGEDAENTPIPREQREHNFLPAGKPIWRRNRCDIVWDEPSAPVSFYLDTDAHTFITNAFGNKLLETVEKFLQSYLSDEDLWLDVKPEITFLELGPKGIDVQELKEAVSNIVEHVQESHPANTLEQEVRGVDLDFEDAFALALKELDVPSWEGEPGGVREIDPAYMMMLSGESIDIFRLAERLGVLDEDLESLPSRLLSAFLEHYGLTSITPDYPTVEAILAKHEPKHAEPFTAVHFHIQELFKLYAGEVLEEETGSPRLADSTLATLAQWWALRTQNTLQLFSSATVEVTRMGSYRISKSRKKLLEFDQQEAYRLAKVLDQLISTAEGEGEAFCQYPPKEVPWQPRSAITFQLGTDFVEHAASVFRETGYDHQRTVARLVADLFDEAFSGNGAIAESLEWFDGTYQTWFKHRKGRG